MSGKKLGLEGKYKNYFKTMGVFPAASGNKNTLSINPMQDDFNKSMGMGTTGAFLTRRAILGAGSKNASSLLEKAGKSSVKEKIKKALTSKTNIGATAGAAGYEIGKTEGKKYGGSMKKMASGGMSKKEKKIKKVMGEYKKGELNIGTSKKKVKSKKQAIAIALASAKKKKA